MDERGHDDVGDNRRDADSTSERISHGSWPIFANDLKVGDGRAAAQEAAERATDPHERKRPRRPKILVPDQRAGDLHGCSVDLDFGNRIDGGFQSHLCCHPGVINRGVDAFLAL